MKRILPVLVLVLVLVLSSVLVAFADADPYVSIVNPSADSTVYSSNLLVSVKVTKAETISVAVAKESTVVTTSAAVDGTIETKTTKTYTNIETPESFTSTNTLSYYTKKFENVTPGNYLITVSTLGKDKKVVYTTTRTVKVAVKETTESAVFSTGQSGTFTFLQNLLKTIFGD